MLLPPSASRPTRADLLALARLAMPIVATQVGIMAMGLVDTLMVGHVSAAALAAVALGNLYVFGGSIFGLGVLFALDPIVAQALGAGDHSAVARALQRGLLLAVLLTVPTSLLLLTVEPVLSLFGQPQAVIPLVGGYVRRVVAATLPFYVFVVLRQTLQAHHRMKPIVWTLIVTNALNALLNYAWIFGHWGFPALGVLGSAWATLVSRWLMALCLLATGWTCLRPYLRQLAPRIFDPGALRRTVRIGMPIGFQMLLEWGAFGFVGLLMGWLGVLQVAAHQIALNLASLTFMVPMGVGSAAAVLVGHAVGRGDAGGVWRSSIAALIVGACFMAAMAALFLTLPTQLAGLFTDSEPVIALAALLLPIAGLFQVFDGLQVVSMGVLRGLGDTRVPMLVSVIGFWCIGIPVSIGLAFVAGLGAVGLWWGFVAALAIVALILLRRLRRLEQREVIRIVIDETQDGGVGHTGS
jgi:MATE family multidrug resistance protein